MKPRKTRLVESYDTSEKNLCRWSHKRLTPSSRTQSEGTACDLGRGTAVSGGHIDQCLAFVQTVHRGSRPLLPNTQFLLHLVVNVAPRWTFKVVGRSPHKVVWMLLNKNCAKDCRFCPYRHGRKVHVIWYIRVGWTPTILKSCGNASMGRGLRQFHELHGRGRRSGGRDYQMTGSEGGD